MRLATLPDGSRDGRLVVVSRDLALCTDARRVAPTLQAALDDWAHAAPGLAAMAHDLELGAMPAERFHEREALAPLPRAYQWIDGSAYLIHMALARKARGAPMPENAETVPMLYQGGSDGFLAPRAPIPLRDEALGADFEGEIAVILGDVPMGATREEAAAAIRLVTLVNDVTLRGLVAAELSRGFGFFQSKPASALAPVAATPEALGAQWDGGRLHGALRVDLNGQPVGRAEAGRDMAFDFPALIVHAARTRPLAAGTIVGAGTVSNRGRDGGPGAPIARGGVGFSCLAEQRAVEALTEGAAHTPFLRFGDTVRIEMRDPAGHSLFGAIEQTVVCADDPA